MKLALTALFLAGCLRPIDSVASVSWQEYQSEHFILDTDVSEEDAATILATFEALRAADLTLLAGAGTDFAGHIRLFIPAQAGLYRQLSPNEYFSAYYTHGVYYSEPIIVAPAGLCLRLPQAVAHELAHAVSYYIYPQQRKWFSEGLAQFVETVGRKPVHNQGSTAAVTGAAGEILPTLARFLRGELGILPVSKLLVATANDRDAQPRLFYDSSWLLYHWLWNADGQELAAFQKRLAEGEGWDDAWRTSFTRFDPAEPSQMDRLDAALYVYRREGRFGTAEVSVKESFTMSKRPFPAMRFWVALLRGDWPKGKEERTRRQREELTRARADDPTNPDILLWLARLEDKPLDADAVRALAAGAPGQSFGWFALSLLTADPLEKERALRQSVAVGPDCANCSNALAWFLATNGRGQEALRFANRAVDLAPWNPAYVDTLAEVASRLGQCKQALQLQTRAVRMTEFAGNKKDDYERRLGIMQERCAAQ